jgi:hypothetical protein
MAAFVVSDRRTSGVSLAAGDSLWLTAGGAISTFGPDGVTGSGGNALTHEGEILARAGVGVLLTGGNNNAPSRTPAVSWAIRDQRKRPKHGHECRPGHRLVSRGPRPWERRQRGVELRAHLRSNFRHHQHRGGKRHHQPWLDTRGYIAHVGQQRHSKFRHDRRLASRCLEPSGRLTRSSTGARYSVCRLSRAAMPTTWSINRGYLQQSVETGGGNDVFDNSFGGVIFGDILMGAATTSLLPAWICLRPSWAEPGSIRFPTSTIRVPC